MRKRAAGIALFGLVAAGCNAIFGIQPGQLGAGPGAGVCLPARPDACSGAVLSDPDNCCASGRSCQGAACTAGECGPVVVTSTPGDDGIGIAVAGDDVIWSTGATLKIYATSISKADGMVREVGSAAGSAFQNISSIVVSGDYVYFDDYATPDIGRFPLAGGSLEIVVKGDPSWIPPAPIGHPTILAAGGNLYWATEAAGIFRAPLAGPFPATAQQVVSASGTYTVAVDDTYVYWDDDASQMLARLPLAQIGGSAKPEMLVPDQNEVGVILVDDDSVIWATLDGVYRTAKEGTNRTVTTLATNTDSSTSAVYTDGRDVFFTTDAYDTGQNGGHVRRVSKKGGQVVEIASNHAMEGMNGITATCDTIFWLDGGSHSLVKATK